jgi:hypothetical protein
MVVHAVAGRGDGRFEAETIVGHSLEKSVRAFAAPAELPDGNFQLRHAGGQIILNDSRIHFLFGNGIAADGETISFFQEQRGRDGSRCGMIVRQR